MYRVDRTMLAIQDEHALRNTLLMAALHYAWNLGNMASFQPTYLFHKLENIHKINAWLGEDSPASAIPLCVRHITSLCLIDVSFRFKSLKHFFFLFSQKY